MELGSLLVMQGKRHQPKQEPPKTMELLGDVLTGLFLQATRMNLEPNAWTDDRLLTAADGRAEDV